MQKVRKKHRQKDSLEIARLIAAAALEKKAENLVILDVQGVSSFADYFVIMSGRSTRHVQGLADAVAAELQTRRVSSSTSEGLNEGLWVLLDYGDVIIHIFYKETRAFYDLEGLWHDAVRVDPSPVRTAPRNKK